MINHAWTLLVNQSVPDVWAAAYVGDELRQPNYAALTLPPYLNDLRRYFFGSTPDLYMLNYRTQQLLNVVHASPLAAYVSALDPRTTYRFSLSSLWVMENVFTPSLIKLAGADAANLSVIGQPAAPDATGILSRRFGVELLDTETVQVSAIVPAGAILTTAITFTSGLSSPVALDGSGYRIKLTSSDPAQRWFVDMLLQPQWDLGSILATIGEGGDAQEALFGTDATEPYATFRGIWLVSTESTLRLAALVLAMIYRTEAIRVG